MKSKEPAYYNCPINEWPEDDRPREKMMKLGAFRLSYSELLAILIRTGAGGTSALDIARLLISKSGGLFNLSKMDYREILGLKIKGIGKAKAVTIAAAMQLARCIESEQKRSEDKIVKSSDDVAKIYGPKLRDLKKEKFMVVLLASNNKIIKDKIVTEGTINSSVITPREVFHEAIGALAAAVILIHNHPSGNDRPSREDIKITKKMVAAGRHMDIPVLDHILIADKKYTSFADEGLLN
ncbi:MAG: DNA repair protein RadC [Candidatus Marinimicrobia bacterium]|nr:DNA repair protein RadC [Candidatus Neomarinimicrobiota bacterium]